MFLLLSFAVVLHQCCATLDDKVLEFPLRLLMIRSIESIGRIAIFPLAAGLFAGDFGKIDPYYMSFMYGLVIPVAIIIFLSQLDGLYRSFRASITGLVYKVNNSETDLDKLTILEVFVFNLLIIKKLSFSNAEIKSKRDKDGSFVNPLKRGKVQDGAEGEDGQALAGTNEAELDREFLNELKEYGSVEVKEIVLRKENENNNRQNSTLNQVYPLSSESPKKEIGSQFVNC